jgi:hypothetical protein
LLTFAKEAGRSTVSVFWKARLSILGQGLSFVAMLLPIFFGKFDELRFLVIVSTLASIGSTIGAWSISSVYPSLHRQHDADLSLSSSVVSVIAICLAALIICWVLPITESASQIILWTVALTGVQAFFIVMNAVAVREQDYIVITHSRFLLGVISVITTLIACLLIQSEPSLVAATIISVSAATTMTAWRKKADWVASLSRGAKRPAKEWLRYYREYWTVNMGNLALTLAFQIASLATLKLGNLSNAWAVVVRIVGGFGTTAQQVIAPIYEIGFSRGLRDGDLEAARQVQRQAVIAGVLFGVLMAGGVFVSLSLGNLFGELEQGERIALAIGATVYCCALGFPAMIYRNLPLAGGKRVFVGWAVAKVTTAGLAFAIFGDLQLLIALVCIEAVFDTLFVILAFRRLQKTPLSIA